MILKEGDTVEVSMLGVVRKVVDTGGSPDELVYEVVNESSDGNSSVCVVESKHVFPLEEPKENEDGEIQI